MKVSTITPCYKMGDYIERFLDDLQHQTLFPNFEVVLDHNDPEDWEIDLVNKYIEKYPPGVINHIITKPVTPIGVSMNTCIKKSKGEYLAIWNVDDLRTPDSLEKQKTTLDGNSNIGVCNINFEIVNKFGSKKGQKIDHTIYGQEEYKRSMILGPFFMFRKSLCKESGYFDEQLKSGADFDFAIRLAHHSKIKFSSGNGGYYLNEGKGASTSGNTQAIEKTVIYKRYGIEDKIIREGCFRFLDSAMKYDIENIVNYNKKINYRNFIQSTHHQNNEL